MPMKFKDHFPLTHENAIRFLMLADWDPQEKIQLSRRDANTLHHGFGTALRNGWHLNEVTSPFRRHYMRHYGIGAPEDISRLIIEDFVARWQNRRFDIKARAAQMRSVWESRGMDPVTLQKVR